MSTSFLEVIEPISDTTQDRFGHFSENPYPPVRRRASLNFFGGSPSFGDSTHSLFEFPSSGRSFTSFRSSQQEELVPPTQPWQHNTSFTSNFLSRHDSVSSTSTSMTDDELSDEVEPWAMATESRSDFGFSSALRDSCVYNVPREYLPLEEDSGAGDDHEWDTVIETDEEDDDEDVSDTATVCADEPDPEPASPLEKEHADPEILRTAGAHSEFFMSPGLPDARVTTSTRLAAGLPRRSARVTRSSHADAVDCERGQTLIKRKHPVPKGPAPLVKKVAFTDQADKPTSRLPMAAIHTKQKGKPVPVRIRRVILRV
ncbi:hypothetical protein K438DRAFT_1931120 [Mycena galopus ATCC 62051]|nr:hypothetical protein K438DRAFT_1931120 [Mycena galopus ATCC 62051]